MLKNSLEFVHRCLKTFLAVAYLLEIKGLSCLTLNRPGFSDDPEAGGGRKYVTFVFVVLDCNFYANHSFMVSNENFGLY